MRKLLLTAILSIFSLWTSGCESLPFFNNRETSTVNTPEASQTPKLEPSESPSPTPTNKVFPSPDIPQKSKTATNLTRSTDPNERSKSLKQETQISDPFSDLPTIPVPSQDSVPGVPRLPKVDSQQVPDLPTLPNIELFSSGRQTQRNQPITQGQDPTEVAQAPNLQQPSQTRRTIPGNQNLGSPKPSSQPNITTPASSQQLPSLPELPLQPTPPAQWRGPGVLPKPLKLPSSSTKQLPSLPELPQPSPPAQWRGPGFPPTPPPPPDTTIADGIEVSGVVQVGSQKQIIVKVPREATSRYVTVGQRLANGQVLVKRVDLKMGADPIVVFEQSGVEVFKEVGSKPTTTEG